MIAAAHVTSAERVFEIGTFLGSNTLNLALSLPQDGKVFTLDLDEESAIGLQQDPSDAPLTQTHIKTRTLDFSESCVGHKVTTLTGNSVTFDFAPWRDSIDLVFIDGGHDYATVKADTENSLTIVRKDKVSSILWHDYDHVDYPDLTTYLNGVSENMTIYHIADTHLCVWFNDRDGSLQKRLLADAG